MTPIIWSIVVLAIVLALVGLVMTTRRRRQKLQDRFGPEYDR